MMDSVSANESFDFLRMQETNAALTTDVKKILESKSRIEGENYLLRKEIERMKESNFKVQSKLSKSASRQGGTDEYSTTSTW